MNEATKAAAVSKFEARGVLAGAYRGKDIGQRAMLTHFYDVTTDIWGAPKSLCGKIKMDNLSDVAEPEHADCIECIVRFSRRTAKGAAVFVTANDRT